MQIHIRNKLWIELIWSERRYHISYVTSTYTHTPNDPPTDTDTSTAINFKITKQILSRSRPKTKIIEWLYKIHCGAYGVYFHYAAPLLLLNCYILLVKTPALFAIKTLSAKSQVCVFCARCFYVTLFLSINHIYETDGNYFLLPSSCSHEPI